MVLKTCGFIIPWIASIVLISILRHYGSEKFSGKGSHLAFVKFIVLNASALESLVLIVDDDIEVSYWWIENQRRHLQLEKRASISCEIKFSSDDCSNHLRGLFGRRYWRVWY
jgi:hypothetical protein